MNRPFQYAFEQIGNKLKSLDELDFTDHSGKVCRMRSSGISFGKIGISSQTILNWINGRHTPQNHAVSELVKALNDGYCLPIKFETVHFSDATSTEEFRNLIGYDRITDYKHQARVWAEKVGIGSSFTLNEQADDQTIEDDWSGLYTVKRSYCGGDQRSRTEKLRLAITYPTFISTKSTEKKRFLICELAVPAARSTVYRYKGFVSFRFSMMTWLFFQERSTDPDMIVMMTDKGDRGSKGPINGHLLTATPEPYRSVPYTVEIAWGGTFNSLEAVEAFLEGGTNIKSEAAQGKRKKH